ncbi:MAG: hypothetical protein U0872_04340 [Planctomycetaceae bacterium]
MTADGWKETSATLQAMFGLVLLENGKLEMQIMYVDTGVMPADVTLTGQGIELEPEGRK